MFNIELIEGSEEKSYICSVILRALPSWFGVETSIIEYIDKAKTMMFWAAFDNEKPVGFAALKVHNPYTSEICVMGALEKYHRLGIGKRLIACCESFCSEKNIEFLTVKTLDESVKSSSYAKTRQFYLALGFRPLEVFPLYWDKDNPCLFMAKHI